MSFAGKRVQLEMIILSKLSQAQEYKYYVFHLWSLNSIVTKTHI